MLLAFARFFTYLSIFSPLLIRRDMFFPFISAKAIFFRIAIELALAFFVLHVALAENRKEIIKELGRRFKQPLLIAFSVFTLIFIITSLTAVNPAQAFWSNFERSEGGFQILHYYVFFLLIVFLFPDRKRLEKLLKINIVVAFLISLYALGQVLIEALGSEGAYGAIGNKIRALGIIAASTRGSGTLGNPSYLAAYLLINFAFLIYFWPRINSRTKKIFWALLMIFEFVIFLNTGTRGALLGLAAGILVLIIINLLQTRSRKLRASLLGLLTIGAAFLVLFFATNSAPFWQHVPVANRFLNISEAARDFGPRTWTWGSALAGVLEKPLLGWGAENFPIAFDRYYNPRHFGIESFFDRAHNNFLEYLIAGGFPLLLAFFSIFICYYVTIKKRPRDFWKSILITIPLVYLIQSFFLFDVLAIYLILFLFLAFILNTERADPLPATTGANYQLNGAGLLSVVVVVGGIVALVYLTALSPLTKNRALARALQSEGTQGVFTKYLLAYETPSPVGQEETIGSYTKFALTITESTLRNPAAVGRVPLEVFRSIVDTANEWFDANQKLIVGVKDVYLNGGLNLNVGMALEQKDYIARGKKMYQDALEQAPTRIELMKVLLDIARMEKDEKTYQELLAKVKFLRPDIRWE